MFYLTCLKNFLICEYVVVVVSLYNILKGRIFLHFVSRVHIYESCFLKDNKLYFVYKNKNVKMCNFVLYKYFKCYKYELEIFWIK